MSLFRFYYNPTTEFDRLFEDALTNRACRASASSAEVVAPRHQNVYRPRLDVHESKDTNTVTATFELPGLTSEDITIDVHQNRLTVSAELASSDAHEERNYVVRERRTGKFSRTLQLPFGTKAEDVKAKVESGVLTITFPKDSPEQQTQRIVIQ